MYENYQDAFEQITGFGLLVDHLQVDTGRMVRCGVNRDQCPVDSNKTKTAGWYSLNSLSIEGKTYLVGSYGYWKGAADNNAQKLEWDKKVLITPEQRKAIAAKHKMAVQQAAIARKSEASKAADLASFIWRKYVPTGESDYLTHKNVKNHGVRFDPKGFGTMAIPLTDTRAKVWGVQLIRGNNRGKKPEKMFQPKGMDMVGKFHLIGSPREVLLISEGYATCASIHEATGLPIAVAFNANNLIPVSKALHKEYPKAIVIICADDDYLTDGNPGVAKGQEAALQVNGICIKPDFTINGTDIRNGQKLTDYNDLANHPDGGLHLVRAQIEEATKSIGIRPKSATKAAVPPRGEGEKRNPAVSVMEVDDIVERFIYVDDVHGDNVFDSWTKEVVKIKKVQGMLPKFVRWDDVKAHDTWMRRAVYRDQIGFDPTEKDSNIVCNRWSGWPTKPNTEATQADCENLLALLMFLCDSEQNGTEVLNWVISWLAYPIQHPGAKLDTALIMHGEQGTGKNLFFEAIGKIYGEHFSVITQDTMEDQFNSDWVDRKLFVLADEIVAVQERTHVKNKLKTMVTGDTIRINQKMIAAYPEKNFFNMVFLSNEANPIVLEKRDRRYFVVWTPSKLPRSFYADLQKEIENGGIQALHQYLLNWDTGDFNPKAEPPVTKAKQDLILLNAETPYVFYHEWRTGELDLPFCPAPAGLVYSAYEKWCDKNGERWKKSSRQFLSSIRTEGVMTIKENHYPAYNDQTGNKRTQFYVPPIKHIEEAAKEGLRIINNTATSKKDYFTSCFLEFTGALEKKQ